MTQNVRDEEGTTLDDTSDVRTWIAAPLISATPTNSYPFVSPTTSDWIRSATSFSSITSFFILPSSRIAPEAGRFSILITSVILSYVYLPFYLIDKLPASDSRNVHSQYLFKLSIGVNSEGLHLNAI